MKMIKKKVAFSNGKQIKLAEIPGGLADGKTVSAIAEMHDVSEECINSQIEMGIKVEMEHTNDKSKAREIAMDHLVEMSDYYTKLEEMESEE